MHGRVTGFVTLTMWVYNRVTLGVLKLATMDVESEISESIQLFLTNFLQMLRQESKEANYMWNPRGFMCDENAANKLAIRAVLGEAMSKKTVSCQWHFLRCARKQLPHVPESKKSEFMVFAKSLTSCATKNDYVKITEKMSDMTKTKKWFEWWHLQHHHFVPVYRDYSLSGLNLAEVGMQLLGNNITFNKYH